ncbi:MAG: hypothetical protein GWP91_11435 [Rhodobacterales bacterium]|nr:hypothetical protein [Rhodobacterales bacterium]
MAVLVEGPEDATPLIQALVHEDTKPPVTLLSTWVDKRNAYGANGQLSATEQVAARFRGWWPLVSWSPEYHALRTGAELGAELRFIDMSLKASVPFSYVPAGERVRSVQERHQAESAFFSALAKRTRSDDFDGFWRAAFEMGAQRQSGEAFFRSLLTFAWCARNVHASAEALERDGTLARERHMRWHIDDVRKAHPEGPIAVVTGAFHTIALPWTKRKRATKADAATTTLLTAHSHRALAALHDQGKRPGWAQRVWEGIEAGEPAPYNSAARSLLLEVMRAARDQGLPLSTADAVGAYTGALGLARLRRHRQVDLNDLLDATVMSYVKGDAELHGPRIRELAGAVLIGDARGQVAESAGSPPLLLNFYKTSKTLRLDLSGAAKTVRCDPVKQVTHRLKSAFLHACDYLDVPVFHALEGRHEGHFRGPNPIAGLDMHLLGERWAVQWCVSVDDRLVELADRGPTLAQVAASVLQETLSEARRDASMASQCLLRCVQMRLEGVFDDALLAVEQASAEDQSFDHLVGALADFVVLYGYRDAWMSRGDARIALVVSGLFDRACIRLPLIANTPDTQVDVVLDRLQSLARMATGFDVVELDRVLLVSRLHQLVEIRDGSAVIRGAALGLLYGFGAVRMGPLVHIVTLALQGSSSQVQRGAGLLEGLFLTARTLFLGRDTRLIEVVGQALIALDWGEFKAILPDLRRAFTQFIPTEQDAIARRVSKILERDSSPSMGPVVPALRGVVSAADARVAAAIRATIG